jgi:DNA-binding NarL/FixJ family response regulator
VRVALAEDSAFFRQALAALLRELGVDVVHQAGDAEEAIEQLGGDVPDVVVLDIRLPPSQTDEGLRAAQRIRERHPRLGILLLSAYDETVYAERLLETVKGGVGYLVKDRVDNAEVLLESLRRVAAGDTVIDQRIVERLMGRDRPELGELTEQQRKVLGYMAEGLSNKGIAQQLHLQTKTVEKYCGDIFSRLGLHDSSENNRRVLAILKWLRQDR